MKVAAKHNNIKKRERGEKERKKQSYYSGHAN
jgi:hypothetical protein